MGCFIALLIDRRSQSFAAVLPPPNALAIPELDCLLEPVLLHGVKHEILRSNAVVVNATAIDLELALTDAAPASPRSTDIATDACYETERWMPMRGWGPVSQHYAWGPGLRHTSASFPTFSVPAGWEWDGAWRVWEGNAHTDEDGWWYSSDIASLGYDVQCAMCMLTTVDHVHRATPTPVNARNPTTLLRRRRLQRVRRRIASTAAEEGTVTSLGVVLAGDSSPLPYGWQQPGRQLVLRPYASDLAASMHDWSRGGQRPLLLAEVDEATTRLMGCQPRGTQSVGCT